MVRKANSPRFSLLLAAIATFLITQCAPLAQAIKEPEHRPRAPAGKVKVFCEYTRYDMFSEWIDVWVYLPRNLWKQPCRATLFPKLRRLFQEVEIPFHPLEIKYIVLEKQCYINFWSKNSCVVMEIIKGLVGEEATNQEDCSPFADELVRPLDPFRKAYVERYKRSLLDKPEERKYWLKEDAPAPPYPGVANKRWRKWSSLADTE